MGCHPAKNVPSAWKTRIVGLITKVSLTMSFGVQAIFEQGCLTTHIININGKS